MSGQSPTQLDDSILGELLESHDLQTPEKQEFRTSVEDMLEQMAQTDPDIATLEDRLDSDMPLGSLDQQISLLEQQMRGMDLRQAAEDSRAFDRIGLGFDPSLIGVGELPKAAQRDATTGIGKPKGPYPVDGSRHGRPSGAQSGAGSASAPASGKQEEDADEMRRNAASILAAAGISPPPQLRDVQAKMLGAAGGAKRSSSSRGRADDSARSADELTGQRAKGSVAMRGDYDDDDDDDDDDDEDVDEDEDEGGEWRQGKRGRGKRGGQAKAAASDQDEAAAMDPFQSASGHKEPGDNDAQKAEAAGEGREGKEEQEQGIPGELPKLKSAEKVDPGQKKAAALAAAWGRWLGVGPTGSVEAQADALGVEGDVAEPPEPKVGAGVRAGASNGTAQEDRSIPSIARPYAEALGRVLPRMGEHSVEFGAMGGSEASPAEEAGLRAVRELDHFLGLGQGGAGVEGGRVVMESGKGSSASSSSSSSAAAAGDAAGSSHAAEFAPNGPVPVPAGAPSQVLASVAVPVPAGAPSQVLASVAVPVPAGAPSQVLASVAVPVPAGAPSQVLASVAVPVPAGAPSQVLASVAVPVPAGAPSQVLASVADDEGRGDGPSAPMGGGGGPWDEDENEDGIEAVGAATGAGRSGVGAAGRSGDYLNDGDLEDALGGMRGHATGGNVSQDPLDDMD